MGGGGFGGLGGMSALGSGPIGSPSVAQTYQVMMQNIQKLLSYNPDYLTKGIPNNLLQMCMEQTKMPTMYGVSVNQNNLSNRVHFVCYNRLHKNHHKF